MSNQQLKGIIIAAVLLVSLYFLSPMFLNMDDEMMPSFWTQKKLNLGLDLQGGMHLLIGINYPEDIDQGDKQALMDRTISVLRNRVDEFGVAEPVIQPQGSDRIIVQLPGLKDPQRAKDLIGTQAELRFKLVAKEELLAEAQTALDEYLAVRFPDTTLADTLMPKPFTEKAILRGTEFIVVGKTNIDFVNENVVKNADIEGILPEGTELIWGELPDEITEETPRFLYLLNEKTELSGSAIKDARVSFGQGYDPRTANKPYVGLEFNDEGAERFENITGANIKRRLAIVLDNVVYSAPVIQDRIPSGRAQITGSFSDADAKDLAIILRAGTLPADIYFEEERTVGPSLGQDSIDKGSMAGLIGLAIVIIFMIIYYKLSGFIANIALLFNMLIVFGVLTMFQATLTLPGIAGIILTVGMAVDANVLIFERIREELDRGKTVRSAIEAGYNRATVTILDANFTTLITALVLYQFGTGPIKGFAVTLSIGIVSSMFTAIVVTRSIFDLMTRGRARRKLSI